MDRMRNGWGTGAGFLGVGTAFVTLAMAGDQPAFLGVGMAFLGLAFGVLPRCRRGGR